MDAGVASLPPSLFREGLGVGASAFASRCLFQKPRVAERGKRRAPTPNPSLKREGSR